MWLDTYDISRQMKRSNELKERELELHKKQHDRDIWLGSLQRATNTALLKMLENTPEYNVYHNYLRGRFNEILYDAGDTETPNQDYIDIRNECIIRGLI